MAHPDFSARRFWLFLLTWQLDAQAEGRVADPVHSLHHRYLEDGGRGDEAEFWRAVQWGHQAGVTDLSND